MVEPSSDPKITSILEDRGYPDEIFINQNSIERLRCSIDLNILREPVVDPCGHSFCKSCINKWISNKRACPLTSVAYKYMKEFSKNFVLESLLSSLEIRCLKYKETCSWKGALENLESHLQKECPDMSASCPNEGCQESPLRREMITHIENNCEFRPMKCIFSEINGCQAEFIKYEGAEHLFKSHLSQIKALAEENRELKKENSCFKSSRNKNGQFVEERSLLSDKISKLEKEVKDLSLENYGLSKEKEELLQKVAYLEKLRENTPKEPIANTKFSSGEVKIPDFSPKLENSVPAAHQSVFQQWPTQIKQTATQFQPMATQFQQDPSQFQTGYNGNQNNSNNPMLFGIPYNNYQQMPQPKGDPSQLNGKNAGQSSPQNTIPQWPNMPQLRGLMNNNANAQSRTQPYFDMDAHCNQINNLILLSPHPLVASCSDDRTIKIWKLENGTLLKTLDGHTGYVLSLLYLRDCNKIVSSSYDETVRVWDIDNGTSNILRGHKGRVRVLENLLDLGQFASGGDDRTIRIWNLSNLTAGSSVATTLDREVSALCYLGAKRKSALLAGDKTGKVYHIKLEPGSYFQKGKTKKQCHDNEIVKIILLDSSNSFLTVASGESSLKIWDLTNITLTRDITVGEIGTSINDVQLDLNFKFLILGLTDQRIKIYDSENFYGLKEFKNEGLVANSLAWQYTDKCLISAGSLYDTRQSKYKYVIRVRRVEL